MKKFFLQRGDERKEKCKGKERIWKFCHPSHAVSPAEVAAAGFPSLQGLEGSKPAQEPVGLSKLPDTHLG